MTVSDKWTEVLRCPACALTGVAVLSMEASITVVIEFLPQGFKAMSSEYGDTFSCRACDRAASAELLISLQFPLSPGLLFDTQLHGQAVQIKKNATAEMGSLRDSANRILGVGRLTLE